MNRLTMPQTAALCSSLLLALSGCSTAPDTTQASAAAATTAAEARDEPTSETLTGSRIPRKSTDRLLRQVGAAGAKEMDRERPPNPGPRTN